MKKKLKRKKHEESVSEDTPLTLRLFIGSLLMMQARERAWWCFAHSAKENKNDKNVKNNLPLVKNNIQIRKEKKK